MATIKNFTSLEQSKKLAEILPLNSADAFYDLAEPEKRQRPIIGFPDEYLDMENWAIRCWSLAALLNVLPQSIRLVGTPKDSCWYCECIDDNNQWYADSKYIVDNPVDACYEIILKLYELKML